MDGLVEAAKTQDSFHDEREVTPDTSKVLPSSVMLSLTSMLLPNS